MVKCKAIIEEFVIFCCQKSFVYPKKQYNVKLIKNTWAIFVYSQQCYQLSTLNFAFEPGVGGACI